MTYKKITAFALLSLFFANPSVCSQSRYQPSIKPYLFVGGATVLGCFCGCVYACYKVSPILLRYEKSICPLEKEKSELDANVQLTGPQKQRSDDLRIQMRSLGLQGESEVRKMICKAEWPVSLSLGVGGLATAGLLCRDLYRWKSSH